MTHSHPAFYQPAAIGSLFYPDTGTIVDAAAAAKLPPASSNAASVHLLLIDMQVDFCHPQGNLYVPGAEGDIARVCDFIFRHAAQITQITSTLDSHLPFQIFHPAWWVDQNGNHPAPFTLITHASVMTGAWQAVRMEGFSAEYTRQLEENAKKVLTIWPYHTMIGGPGNMLDPMLWSVIQWHSLARNSQPAWVTKGTIPQTEHYSAIQPEIPLPNNPASAKNIALLDQLAASDYVLIAGEAESHCVLATLTDIVDHFANDPEKLSRIYVFKDCMSPVIHPEVDFHALAWQQFEQFIQLGVQFVNSTDRLPFMTS